MAVVKYGVGNIYSVQSALRRLGASPFVAPGPREALGADAVILPGVGAHPAAMRVLAGQEDALRALLDEGVPVLGICLGMQLFFEESEEGGRGLGLLPGRVELLRGAPRLPHIGWTRVYPRPGSELMEGVEPGSYLYFAHSYAVLDTRSPWVAATARHGPEFAAAVEKPPLYGTQFHPERSGRAGAAVLASWLKAARR